MHLVNQEKEHYVDLCASLRKEKEEIQQESEQLKSAVKEVMTVVTEEEFSVNQPIE